MKRVLSVAGRTVVGGALMLCGMASGVRAQASEPRDRWALGLAADVGAVPELMADRCGSIGDDPVPTAGLGAAVVFAPKSWLVVSSDSRLSGAAPADCALTGPALTSIGNGQWERFDHARSYPTTPLMRSAVRVGVQTPRGMPLLRATVGGGVLWGSTPSPFGAVTAGVGTRGEHLRFYAELEGAIARVRMAEIRSVYHFLPNGAPVEDSRTTTPSITHPHWVMAHIGIEVPFASR